MVHGRTVDAGARVSAWALAIVQWLHSVRIKLSFFLDFFLTLEPPLACLGNQMDTRAVRARL